MFDSGGCSGRLLGCPFLGRRRALLGERVRLGRCDDIRGWSLFVERGTASSSSKEGKQVRRAVFPRTKPEENNRIGLPVKVCNQRTFLYCCYR